MAFELRLVILIDITSTGIVEGTKFKISISRGLAFFISLW